MLYVPEPAPPTSVRAARIAAGAQAALCLASAAYLLWRAVRSGSGGGEFAGLAQFVYGILSALCAATGVFVGVPALLFRPHSAAPRIILLIVEPPTAGLALLQLAPSFDTPVSPVVAASLALYVTGAVVTLAAITRPSARWWSAPARTTS